MIDLEKAFVGNVLMRGTRVHRLYSHAKIVAILDAHGIGEDNASAYTDEFFGDKPFAILFDEVPEPHLKVVK